ncbi:MAG: helix-turn-helix domain-containing protein [Chitinophagales bacterium]|jgi:transcriptional regulator with XRE-family HTH domain|nr:helix-turn-helix domain-containing protein [Chitinophagales bacterium]HNI43289.1 helix-turn-helix domain-containing protein [Chitinophagales bacterium]
MKQQKKSSNDVLKDNIKLIRKIKDLPQDKFADELSIKRSALGSYEEGRAEPNKEVLVTISEKYNISIDRLMKENLTQTVDTFLFSGEKNIPYQLTGNVDIKGKNMRVLSITTDNRGKENIELVPQRAAASYLRGYSDQEYIKELPKFQLPFLPSNKTYRAFEIMGDSMLPLKEGSIVVAEYVEDWEDVKSGQTYIVVSEQDGIVYKRAENLLNEGKLRLHSDNPNYPPFLVNVGDIKEIWKAKTFIATDMPDNEVTLEKLLVTVMELRSEIQKMQK